MAKLKINKWVLTPHAVEKIVDRKISILELEELILNPDIIINQGPKFILVKKFSNRKYNNIAAVILEKKGKDLWVVIIVMINLQIK